MTKEQQPRTKKGMIIKDFTDALDSINRGAPAEILTYPQMSKKYDTDLRTVSRAVRDGGLQKKLAEAREQAKAVDFTPSSDAAWFLGIMTGAGRVGKATNDTQIVLTHEQDTVLEAFRTTGESLMNISGQQLQMRDYGNSSVVFYSRPYAHLFGDFQKNERANTIRERFGWAIEDPYTKDFMSGVLDASGTILLTPQVKKVEFFTTQTASADLYRIMLRDLGIERPLLIGNAMKRQGIQGVGIYNVPDMQTFAERVTSVDPFKQKQLAIMKDLGVVYRKRNIPADYFPQ